MSEGANSKYPEQQQQQQQQQLKEEEGDRDLLPLRLRLKRRCNGTNHSTIADLTNERVQANMGRSSPSEEDPVWIPPLFVSPERKVTAAALLVLTRLFRCSTVSSAKEWLCCKTNTTSAVRRELAEWAGLSSEWSSCDQAIAENRNDLSAMVIDEIYKSFWFFRTSLRKSNPRERYRRRIATRPMTLCETKGFWSAKHGTGRIEWLLSSSLPSSSSSPKRSTGMSSITTTFDAVVHFVQEGVGTGVHVGNGWILTCAHVIDSRDDDDNNAINTMPNRIGRQKIVVFPSERTFLTRCIAVEETVDGGVDVAVVQIEAEIDVGNGTNCNNDRNNQQHNRGSPPAAVLANEPCEIGADLFCIGNPSQINLENSTVRKIDSHQTWHTSVGSCLGYMEQSIQDLFHSNASRGRPPTRAERRRLLNPEALSSSQSGGYLLHTCWTYWGHSGAPLFDRSGKVVGLHCAWDDSTGMRHGQKLGNLLKVIDTAARVADYKKDAKALRRGKRRKKRRK